MPQETVRLGVVPSIRTLIAASENPYANFANSLDPASWKQEVAQRVMHPGDELLQGGHRNLVVKRGSSNEVDVFWRQSDIRWPQIIKGILVEDALSRHFGIPSRQLIDAEEPVSITDEGLLVTRTLFTPGEMRYPYNSLEIASAIDLMGRMHQALKRISFEGEEIPGNNQWIHGDFGRANVLFQPGSAEARTVIDFETAAIGPVTQDLGRFISILLVDAKLPRGRLPSTVSDEVISLFEARAEQPLNQYPFAAGGDISRQKYEAVVYAAGYLFNENFGTLNGVRDLALQWLVHRYDLRA